MNQSTREIVSGPGRKAQMFQNSIDIIKDFQREGFSVVEYSDENGQEYYSVTITEKDGKKTTQYKVYNLQDLEDLYQNYFSKEEQSKLDENVTAHVEAVNNRVFEHYISGEKFDLPGYNKDVLIKFLDIVFKNSSYNNYGRKLLEIKSLIDILRRYDISGVIQYFLENPIDMVNPYALEDKTMLDQGCFSGEKLGVIVYIERGRSFCPIEEPEFLEEFLGDLKNFLDKIMNYERAQKYKDTEHEVLDIFDRRKVTQIIYKSSQDFLKYIMDNCHRDGLSAFIKNLESPIGWNIMNYAFVRGASWITYADTEGLTKIIEANPIEFAQYLNDLYSPEEERNISNGPAWSELMEEIQEHFRKL